MSCKSVCRLCKRLVISQAVTFADNTLAVNLPAGSYNDGQKYCVVVAQAIPETATITAPVVITIGDGTEEYPLTDRCCSQILAASLRTRTRYATIVSTNAAGGSFKLLGKASCAPNNNLTAIDGTAPVTGGGGA